MSLTRPIMFAGPIGRQRSPAMNVESSAGAWAAAIRPTHNTSTHAHNRRVRIKLSSLRNYGVGNDNLEVSTASNHWLVKTAARLGLIKPEKLNKAAGNRIQDIW